MQLRAEDPAGQSYNLVGFQTNLTFPEQRRVFRMIPGLEQAEFARYGVMHRNTFLDAPRLLDGHLRLATPQAAALPAPVYVAGQIAGTEGEAMRSGLHAALAVAADLAGIALPASARDGVRRAFGLGDRSRYRGLPADARELRHHGAARSAGAQQAQTLRCLRRASAEALAAYQSALAACGLARRPCAPRPKVPAAARTKGLRSDRSRPGDARGAGLRSLAPRPPSMLSATPSAWSATRRRTRCAPTASTSRTTRAGRAARRSTR